MFIDSHCHLDFPDLAAREAEILAAMHAAQVTHALCISVNLQDFPRVLSLAERHPHLFASVGVHPDYELVPEVHEADLLSMGQHPRVVAIGETGLDYYRLQGNLAWQRERFRTHIRAAIQLNKPLIVHTRAAAEDTLRILREEGAERVGGVMHCFTEHQSVADAALALNFYISFSGIVTFKSAAAIKEVARNVPLDRLLIETDSPYLAPVPHRGQMNQPAWVTHVAQEIANLRGLTVAEVGQASTENFFRLFRVAASSGDVG
ncbi:MAG: TatD family hydrolase [Betaproteobacteria bacterium]|nr:TatD family hydrolase [Betaproteobacteria bacterium]